MELQKIREKLDKIDRSINYLIFLRTSAAVLVGETKKEQDLPIFQPKREKEIYQRQKVFAEERGINEQLLIQISKLLIEEAVAIEEKILSNSRTYEEEEQLDIWGKLEQSEKALEDFLAVMEEMKI